MNDSPDPQYGSREEPEGPNQTDLLRIRVFSGPQAVMEADLARNILATEGIPCVLPGQYTAEMLPGVDVVQLFVLSKDAERAQELLRAYFDTPQQAGEM
jgi:hypothetical protein